MSAYWEKIVTYPGIARRLFGACEWNNRIIIAGGLSTAGAYLNDVWESSDGIIWNRLCTGINSFSVRSGHVLLVHDNRLYVIGGYNGTSYFSDVWTSLDGTKWDRIANSAFTTREFHAAYSLNNKLFVVGGYNGSVVTDVWRSPDGVIWNRLLNSYGRISKYSCGFCVFNNRAHLICGYNGTTTYNTDVSSADGENWDITGSSCGLPTAYDMAAAVFDNRIVLTGGYFSRSAAESRELFYSGDGEKYHCGVKNMGFTIDQHKMVALKNPNRLFILFGYNGSAVRTDVWQSTGNWLDD